ncbi:hypothetical protein M436DRAFT_64277 [Aureobasidium namibiae CBS 147.97]|uniref:Secreted protein n=1 Tax=Aureobasidium namibiae CBS 147.97 TaxID=1043004 RepID=A0A074WJ44_9PEZI
MRTIAILALLASSAYAYLDIYDIQYEAFGPTGDTGYDLTQPGIPLNSNQNNDYCGQITCNNGNVVNLANGPCTEVGRGDFYANLYAGTDQSNLVGTCTWNFGQASKTCGNADTGGYAQEVIKCDTTYC